LRFQGRKIIKTQLTYIVLKMYKNIFHGLYFFKKSCFLFLATEQAPKFIREIKEVRLKEGMRGRFEAVFAGNPKPEITWYFQGKQLENSKNVQIKVIPNRNIIGAGGLYCHDYLMN
jgi:hypothetical protein